MDLTQPIDVVPGQEVLIYDPGVDDLIRALVVRGPEMVTAPSGVMHPVILVLPTNLTPEEWDRDHYWIDQAHVNQVFF